jgi:alkylation response protein AidB-like acyl-CoA dehydrogenase
MLSSSSSESLCLPVLHFSPATHIECSVLIYQMIDFTLTPAQNSLRLAAQYFAKNVLATAPGLYNAESTPDRKFQSTHPLYAQAVEGGLLKGQIPTQMGGTGGSLIDAAILVEELYSVECSASLTVLGTGLGLTPLILAGSPEQQKRLFKRFLEADGIGEYGTPIAGFVFSEPGGSANWLEPGGSLMATTARQEGEEWVITGEKVRYFV